jgi:hypothetical protein
VIAIAGVTFAEGCLVVYTRSLDSHRQFIAILILRTYALTGNNREILIALLLLYGVRCLSSEEMID